MSGDINCCLNWDAEFCGLLDWPDSHGVLSMPTRDGIEGAKLKVCLLKPGFNFRLQQYDERGKFFPCAEALMGSEFPE